MRQPGQGFSGDSAQDDNNHDGRNEATQLHHLDYHHSVVPCGANHYFSVVAAPPLIFGFLPFLLMFFMVLDFSSSFVKGR